MPNLQHEVFEKLKVERLDKVDSQRWSGNILSTALLALGLPWASGLLDGSGDSRELSDHPMCGIPTGGKVSDSLIESLCYVLYFQG